jgi:hypothetical protein
MAIQLSVVLLAALFIIVSREAILLRDEAMADALVAVPSGS